MEIPRLSDSVQKVTVLQRDAAGDLKPVVIYQGEKKKKKRATPGVGRLEELVRDLAQAQRNYLDSYLARHDQSNQETRDGWVRDFVVNNVRAARKASRRFR